jgi:hypothetical protein
MNVTREDIAKVMDDWPDLNSFGFGVFITHHRNPEQAAKALSRMGNLYARPFSPGSSANAKKTRRMPSSICVNDPLGIRKTV